MRILGGTMVEISGNAVNNLVAAGTKADRSEALTRATSQISTLVDNVKSTGMSAKMFGVRLS